MPDKFQRARQARWDRRRLVTVGTHLTREQHELLRLACEVNHTTPYHIVRAYLLEYIAAVRRRLAWDAVPVDGEPGKDLPAMYAPEFQPSDPFGSVIVRR